MTRAITSASPILAPLGEHGEHAPEGLHAFHPALRRLFHPSTVAVIGATERPGSVGRAVMQNLDAFTGAVYAVNPRYARVLQRSSFGSVALLPEVPDLAIIVVPAPSVPAVVEECANAGVPSAIIISAGFREVGMEGAALENAVLKAARGRVRLLGPNCLGIMLPHLGLNASFSAGMPRPGHVAFLSQSGALCTAVLDWSLHDHVGFSAFVSVGAMADLQWGDLLDYFGADPLTKSIVCYMESMGDAPRFLAAARRVTPRKPIIVLKAGRTKDGARAAASHTGAMTGADDVISAALDSCGVLRVQTIEELFDMAEVLAKQPRPAGPRLAVLTNAGGPGALAADEVVSSGAALAALSPGTNAALGEFLPAHWSHGNPVDLIGTATGDDYGKAAALLLQDPAVDGVLAILTPQAMTDPARAAANFALAGANASKPMLACWMGEQAVSAAGAILDDAGVPTFTYPDQAARAFALMWRQSKAMELRQEKNEHLPAQKESTEQVRVSAIVARARSDGRSLLTELEANEILEACGIPVLTTIGATTAEEAVAAAARLGFPVALKLWSRVITHKKDAGGVRLDLGDAGQVRQAWSEIRRGAEKMGGRGAFLGAVVQPMLRVPSAEVIIGSSVDPAIGPVLLFGAGGILAEALRDRALGLPPIGKSAAAHLIDRTRIGHALRSHRSLKGRVKELENILVRFSRIIEQQPWILEMEMNPVAVTEQGCFVVDARVVVAGPIGRHSAQRHGGAEPS